MRPVKRHLAKNVTQWTAITSIASKIDCVPGSPPLSVRNAERERWEPRRANEIVRNASAYLVYVEVASEIDHRGICVRRSLMHIMRCT